VSKNTRRLAQERARQVVAAQRRAEARRRRMTWAGGAIGVVVLILAVFVVVKLTGGNSTPAVAQSAHPADSGLISAVTGVSSSVLDQVGTGKPDALPKTMSGQPALNDNSKPLILYIGAEYCPYCAAQRWAIVTALSRFGTFSSLSLTHSSSSDALPNTPTFSFHDATYSSDVLAFRGIETQGNAPDSSGSYPTLDTPTATQDKVFAAENPQGSIPFVDIGGQFVSIGVGYDASLLQGMTWNEVAKALHDPTSQIARGAVGTANVFTAAICRVTGDKPGAVCSSPTIQSIEKTFGR
jgi:hypothetical protein